MERRLPGRLRRTGVVYVSRAAMHARLAGEAYLEVAMRTSGASVIRPETMSLREQLEVYVGAETILFPEGSAVQSSRLLGRSLGHVIVILRRPGDRIAEDGLRPRTASLRYRDVLVGVVCGLNSAGRPFEVLGLPVLDVDRLLDDVADVLPRSRSAWDARAYRAARDADALAWLQRSLDSPRVRGRHSWEHMLATMEACGLGHLVGEARSMMARHPDSDRASG